MRAEGSDPTIPDGLSSATNDVTERRRAADALRASEARYATLFESIDEGFCTFEMIFDAAGKPVDYRFRSVNAAFEALTGLTKAVALGGRTIREMVPGHEQKWFDLYGRVARTGEPIRIEDHAEALGRRYEIHAFRIGGEGSVEVGALFKDVALRYAEERERERLHFELTVERERLESLFKMSPSAIAVVRGESLTFEFANRAYRALVGREALVGKTFLDALPEIESQGFGELLRGVMATGESFRSGEVLAVLQPTADEPAKTIYVDLLCQAIQGTDDSTSGVFIHAVDVTDQVLARKAIGEREELFRTVFEQAPDDAILVMDEDRVLTAWNPAAERICGWTASEAIGGPADIIFTPEDRAAGVPEGETMAAARDGKAEDERWHVRKDGTRFWGSGTMNALHSDDGGVRGYLKVFRDATERYEETQTLAFLSLLTEAVVDQRDADAILGTAQRMTGQYLGVSRVIYGEFAVDEEEFTVRFEWTRDVASLVGTHRLDAFGSRIAANLRAGRTDVIRDCEREFTPEDGLLTLRAGEAASAITVPVRKEGRMIGIFAVNDARPREWTQAEIDLVQQVADRMVAEIERARAERALREANRTLEERVLDRTAQLEAAVKEAEGFNYSIAHDLRTPLRAIVSTASILIEELGPDLGEEHRTLLTRQADNAIRLGRLIDELLRLSRLARAEVKRETLDMSRKARTVFDELSEHGRTNGCRLEVQEGMLAEGDLGLVRTVLHNFLGNACKFSPGGGIVRVREAAGVFSVADEGVGFDMRFAPKVFLPFERLVSEAEFEGTGIGLANVERIVKRHGGRVWVESEPGRGTTFFFTLGA